MTPPSPARRLTLLLSTPRIAPGLFTRDAWSALERASAVLARDADESQLAAIQDAGMAAAHLGELEPGALAHRLVDLAAQGEVVWVGAADGDPGLTDALAAEVSRRPDPPEVEVLVGSYDVPGARLLDLVAVMDRLRSPGGCPWDARQTHDSLVPHLIEEAHELVEAIETGDRAHMAEELGDVLLQVVFHARMAQDDPQAPFGIDEVAGRIVDKLVRRHPHVFAVASDSDATEPSAVTDDEVATSWDWDRLKAAEKPHRTSVLDGIPAGLPALARAQKVLGRLAKVGMEDVVTATASGDDLGSRLMTLVLEARATGQDADAALRAVLREVERVAADRESLERGSVPAHDVDSR